MINDSSLNPGPPGCLERIPKHFELCLEAEPPTIGWSKPSKNIQQPSTETQFIVYFQECVVAATYQYSSNPYQYEPPTNSWIIDFKGCESIPLPSSIEPSLGGFVWCLVSQQLAGGLEWGMEDCFVSMMLILCLFKVMFYVFYHGKSPLKHHLGNLVFVVFNHQTIKSR